MWTLLVMLSFGMALFGYVDGQARNSGVERTGEAGFDYAEGLLSTHAYVITGAWPSSSAGALPDCINSASGMTAVGGTASILSCPVPAELSGNFSSNDYSGSLTWTSRVRDNGGTDTCAVTSQPKCSYYYDDATALSQPSWDANGDGQLWVRSSVVLRGVRRTLVERVELDKQTVQFPQAVLTAGHFTVKDSPHIKVVTNFSPINLRCAINTAGCLVVKKTKQIAPYKINFSYPQQTAIPSASLADLRARAKAEGWWYPSCPTNPPGSQVFVESGNCTGASMPYTSPTQQGVYIQAAGTLTISGKQPNSATWTKGRKGNFWGLIYLANTGKLTGDVLTVKAGKRLIRGVVAIDWGGGMNLGGSKDTLLQYDPFAIQGLYLYEGTALVRPSFRIISTQTP